MENKRPERLLRDAAQLIERALVQLDTSSEQCQSCKLAHYTNMVHHTVNQRLQQVPARLRREAHYLETSVEDGINKIDLGQSDERR